MSLLFASTDEPWFLTRVVVPIVIGLIGVAVGAASKRFWMPYAQVLWEREADACISLVRHAADIMYAAYAVSQEGIEPQTRGQRRDALFALMPNLARIRGELFIVSHDPLMELSAHFGQAAARIGHASNAGNFATQTATLLNDLQDAHLQMINGIRSRLQVHDLGEVTRSNLDSSLNIESMMYPHANGSANEQMHH